MSEREYCRNAEQRGINAGSAKTNTTIKQSVWNVPGCVVAVETITSATIVYTPQEEVVEGICRVYCSGEIVTSVTIVHTHGRMTEKKLEDDDLKNAVYCCLFHNPVCGNS
jgi:hypothetical protein